MLCSQDPREKADCRETIHYNVWVSGVPTYACHLPLHIDYPGRLTSLWVRWDNDLVTQMGLDIKIIEQFSSQIKGPLAASCSHLLLLCGLNWSEGDKTQQFVVAT